MSKISQRIITNASRLFAEKGYEKVSLRNIADAAGTTIGNLTYHYPQKDKLIEAIFIDVQTQFFNKVNLLVELEDDPFDRFLKVIGLLQKSRNEHPYYFKNMAQLCKVSDQLMENMDRFSSFLHGFFIRTYDDLSKKGILRDDVTPEGYAVFARVSVLTVTLWQKAPPIFVHLSPPAVNMETAMHGLLFPYLTVEGINLFRRKTAQSGPAHHN